VKHLTHLFSGVPVDGLLQQLAAHPEMWDAHGARTRVDGSPHRYVSDVWVRYQQYEEFCDPKRNDPHKPHESVWYPLAYTALPDARRIALDVMRHVNGTRLGGVLITRIPPHRGVEPHVDNGWHARYYSKYAVQLKSAPGQAFCFEDGEYESRPGDLYTFDNAHSHWVKNPTDQERMTLICCIRTEH
jgi:hypothetical protein